MWNIHEAIDNLNNHLLKERDNSLQCIICGDYLFDSENEIIRYTDYLEFQKQVISWNTKNQVRRDIFYVYPYQSNPPVYHHISYKDDICVPVCHSCHGKIHGNKNKEFDDLQPDMKKPLTYR